MPDMSREQLVELITREVIRSMHGAPEPEPDKSGCPPLLVIGNSDMLPKSVRDKYRICGMEGYTGPDAISNFDAVYITELTMTELADIALGRDTHPNQCAVIAGLMCGVPIYLMDSALGHRKQKLKCSRGFFQLLEGYVRTLQNFGIKLVTGQTPIDKYVARSAPGAELPDGVITEAIARSIVEKNSDTNLYFHKGTVFTPSARDVFLHAGRILQIV